MCPVVPNLCLTNTKVSLPPSLWPPFVSPLERCLCLYACLGANFLRIVSRGASFVFGGRGVSDMFVVRSLCLPPPSGIVSHRLPVVLFCFQLGRCWTRYSSTFSSLDTSLSFASLPFPVVLPSLSVLSRCRLALPSRCFLVCSLFSGGLWLVLYLQTSVFCCLFSLSWFAFVW